MAARTAQDDSDFFDDEIVEYSITSFGSYLIPSIPVALGALTFFDVCLCHKISQLGLVWIISIQNYIFNSKSIVQQPHMSLKLRKMNVSKIRIITLNTFKVGILACVIFFVVLPIIYRYSYNFQRAAVFLNFVNVPPSADYENPQKYGINGARNFYINSEEINLGTWQILPGNLEGSNETSGDFFDRVLDNGQNVVIYSHGNGGCRLSSHRIEVYQVLRQFFHVIAFDYRSYGDSSKQPPSELALVEDILIVYEWVRNRTKSNVFIWGHSLGTSLSSHAFLKIQSLSVDQPVGLMLESPFNNMREEISEFPLAKLFRFLPWFRVTIVDPMSSNFKFETDQYICGINVPIMIMHAEDDRVVPYKLGYRLYTNAKKCRSEDQGRLLFYTFSGQHNFGHKFICRASDLPDKISTFIQLALETKHDKGLQH